MGIGEESCANFNYASRNVEFCRLLLKHNANINTQNHVRDTPLHDIAFYQKNRTVMKFFLENHARVDVKDRLGMTPLHLSAMPSLLTPWSGIKPVPSVSKLLLEFNSSAHIKDVFGDTPMHYAALFGQTEIAKLLLDHKADIDSTCIIGDTPLHNAAQIGQLNAIKFLVEHGANVSQRNEFRHTPADYAKGDIPGIARSFVKLISKLVTGGHDHSQELLCTSTKKNCQDTYKYLMEHS